MTLNVEKIELAVANNLPTKWTEGTNAKILNLNSVFLKLFFGMKQNQL